MLQACPIRDGSAAVSTCLCSVRPGHLSPSGLRLEAVHWQHILVSKSCAGALPGSGRPRDEVCGSLLRKSLEKKETKLIANLVFKFPILSSSPEALPCLFKHRYFSMWLSTITITLAKLIFEQDFWNCRISPWKGNTAKWSVLLGFEKQPHCSSEAKGSKNLTCK